MAFDPNWKNTNNCTNGPSSALLAFMDKYHNALDIIEKQRIEQVELIFELETTLLTKEQSAFEIQQEMATLKAMIQTGTKTLHSIEHMHIYLNNFKKTQVNKFSENQRMDEFPDLNALKQIAFALEETHFQPIPVALPNTHYEEKEQKETSIEHCTNHTANPEHDAIIKAYLSNPYFLSTTSKGVNESKVVADIKVPFKSQWPHHFALNKIKSTFSNFQKYNVKAKIIYLNSELELLVALADGHVLYSALKSIPNLILLNQKCCIGAGIYSINLLHGELVQGTIHWDERQAQYTMIDLKKASNNDIYMAWSPCQNCKNISI